MTPAPALIVEHMRRRRAPDEYRLYKAALEWDLLDPIVIQNRDDLKSESVWKNRVEPFSHQVSNLITFCRRLPVTLLADDVGLGKTISAGLVISELIARGRVNKALVVCPKLLGPQWQEELRAKFNLESVVVAGRDLVDTELDKPGAVITTYASARLYLDDIPKDRFEMLILDEAHKLRNLYGIAEPPQVAIRFRAALEERRFRYVLMLTATPIHNRLWDLYSLVDLLTVARGHKNPFGTEGEFARRFISDSRTSARVLKEEARDEFRSIVYTYMSRVRRADAGLHFPERVVQMHKVPPTDAETLLIRILTNAIKKLNKLAQISLLQALVSSPDALMAQLTNMARKGTVPDEVREAVASVVRAMPRSAKLQGLAALIKTLQAEEPSKWRLVVFTTRLETQTTIEVFLTGLGLRVGTINGASGPRNQQTLAHFRRSPPECNVIVSTEAGAEGVNLQVANVLVNFDLPWNPMIVEQRIGRIQRLASNYERVAIYNIILAGTFEEFVVGRLMQKLQMAATAIGDIESILEAAGMDDDDGSNSFEEQIRRLVVKALEERDVERDTALVEESIKSARVALEEHQETLEATLGRDNGGGKGPRPPSLHPTKRSMTARDFAIRALNHLGGQIVAASDGTYILKRAGRDDRISFDPEQTADSNVTVYAPGTRSFESLVGRIVQNPIHDVSEPANDPEALGLEAASAWVGSFGGIVDRLAVRDVQRSFDGTVLVRARATVAHDSYERLVPVTWTRERGVTSRANSSVIREPITELTDVGADATQVVAAAIADEGIAEFCRFYTDRRTEEVARAGADTRRGKKLEDEFTPRLALSAVGLDGSSQRLMHMEVRYRFGDSPTYSSYLLVAGRGGTVIEAPLLAHCEVSKKSVPQACLSRCDISGKRALTHLLIPSDVSGRLGLPDKTAICSVSGKTVLQDEVEPSGLTGLPVLKSMLKTSPVSGVRAEAAQFVECELTGAEVLKSELGASEFSGKRFRVDQKQQSAISGKVGHVSEFFACSKTGKTIGKVEGEQCWATKTLVAPGVLKECELTGRRVLPEEIANCSVTKKNVHKQLLVESSVSNLLVLEKLAVKARSGKYCLASESRRCRWSGRPTHPDDVDHCAITGLPVDRVYLVEEYGKCLKPVPDLLTGRSRPADIASEAHKVAAIVERAGVNGKIAVESMLLAPNKQSLLAGIEVRKLLGFRVHHAT